MDGKNNAAHKLRTSQKNARIKKGATSVNLTELIGAFTLQSQSVAYYVNSESGEIFPLIEGMIIDSDILHSDEYIPLPAPYELNRYAIMESFVFTQDITIQKILAHAIRRKGAFGRFKKIIQAYNIDNQWYEYEHEQLKKIAIESCHHNGLVYK